MDGEKRASFGGKIGAILVSAGSAIGLGNIWRFPYIAGENGGGAFLCIYLVVALLLGLPIMLSEFSIGRATKHNAVGAFRALDKRWVFLGYNGVLASFLILGFYFVVSGWTAGYMLFSLTGTLGNYSTGAEYTSLFEGFMSNPWQPLLCTLLFIFATHLIVALGVQKGIERSSKVMMPLLFLAFIVLGINSLLLPGGEEGLRFFFEPDFSKVTGKTILLAVGQAFFSLSLGIGTMITYASYFKSDTNLKNTALNVTLLGASVAVLAGIVIFPAVFSTGIEPASGPSLVFITLPSIFQNMPLSGLWSTLFFFLLMVAALTSTISLHEVLTAYLQEEWQLSRRKAAWTTTLATALLASLASLSMGVLSDYTLFGLTLFDGLDYLTANIMLPIGGLLTCIFVVWRFDRKCFKAQLSNDGRQPFAGFGVLLFLLRYLCPTVLLVMFLYNLGLF